MEQRSGVPRPLIVQLIYHSSVKETTKLCDSAGKGEGGWSDAAARQSRKSSNQSSLPAEVMSVEDERKITQIAKVRDTGKHNTAIGTNLTKYFQITSQGQVFTGKGD